MGDFQQIGLATVEAIRIDKEGVFFNLLGQPMGEALVGRLSTDCGDNYGRFIPFDVGDTVVYACPSGDPGDGVWVFGRFWEVAEKVPDAIVDAPGDEHWVAKAGRRLTTQTTKADNTVKVLSDVGVGEVKVAGDGTISAVPPLLKMVKLGSENLAELDNVALYTQLSTQFNALVGIVNGLIGVYNGHVHSAGAPTPFPTAPPTATFGGGAVPMVPAGTRSPNVLAKK